MKNIPQLICAIVCTTFSMMLSAQSNNIDVNTDVDIVKVYEQVVKEGYATLDIYKELATAQYFRSNYSEAKKWFEKWFELETPTDKTIKHRYKQTLRALKISTMNNKYLAVGGGGSN